MSALSKNRVVVAMSGGVDSSVAAWLLKEQGYEVIGISMKTHEEVEPCPEELPTFRHAAKNCCSVEDIIDARAVCQLLDIPFYAMNFKKEFKEKVMDYFADEYAAGRTPNPCVKCNDELKFDALLRQARALGAYYLATGHYVQKQQDESGQWHLYCANDTNKDQSYFLFGLRQSELEHILFPVGAMNKEEVREIARKAGIATSEKTESQEICFVPNNDYARVIEQLYPDKVPGRGTFRNERGEPLGTHRGTHAFTIGQRRGLGVAAGERLYVTRIDSQNNEVVLGTDNELYRNELEASEINWVGELPSQQELHVEAKIRYRQTPAPAIVRLQGEDKATIQFVAPQRAITPGQVIVFYHDNELLGGGWIQ